jgi:HNH endonuclease
MSTGTPWSPVEEAILRWTWPEIPTADIAALIMRSLPSIKSRAKVLRLRKKHNYHCWTPAEDLILHEDYPDAETSELAERFGTTILATYRRAAKLGVRKSKQYIAKKLDIEAQRLRLVGVKYRYRKGRTPENKGLRRPGYSVGRGRMAETQFKKGERSGIAAKNWRPIGTILPDGEGFLRIKVREGTKGEAYGFGNVKIWPLLNRHIWEQHNGPIPAGHIVAFKDGDRAHCEIDNLELISRAELMIRNTIHNLPPALKQVIQLTGALKRKIRNREEKLNGQEHAAGSAGPPVCPTGSVERQRQSAGA